MSHYHPCNTKACAGWGYQLPPVTLAEALDTLPASNHEYEVWMREHGLGHGAGIGAVINAVRADLRKLAGGANHG